MDGVVAVGGWPPSCVGRALRQEEGPAAAASKMTGPVGLRGLAAAGDGSDGLLRQSDCPVLDVIGRALLLCRWTVVASRKERKDRERRREGRETRRNS